MIETILQSTNAEIIVVESGAENIDAVKAHPDISLKIPETDVFEATRKIRAFNRDVIIIAHTALAMEGDKECACLNL